MGARWEFRILGPLEVLRNGAVVPIPAAKQRVVLASLLLDANRVVSFEVLTNRLWGSAPPQGARLTLQNYAMRLRRALGDGGALIVTRHAGYMIEVDGDALDAHRFDELVRRARQVMSAGNAAWGATLLGQALALWRGEPLCDVPSEVLHREVATGLTERRLAAVEARIEADLVLGRHQEVITELQGLTARYPLREQFWAQLLLALYRSGRQAEALESYRAVGAVLADEMGVDPNPELQQLHQRILAADPVLARPGAVQGVQRTAPRQLPAPPRWFTGRAGELTQLDETTDQTPTVVISTISGPGGIGKTALALHWAHRNIDRFPDGQLYVNLRGFDRSGNPTPPAAAVRRFLDALGVAPEAIPVDLESQAALYRSLTADRRMLVVLDNARDTAQVVPLLPGGTTCTVLVTSRHRLGGLVTTHGAQPLILDVFAAHDARELLASRIGHGKMAAEPAAADDLLEHCAGLPLAVSIVAARAATHPHVRLATLASELAEASNRLNALDGGELTANLRVAFSASYAVLDARTARMFCQLGLVPAPEISLPAAASLAGLSAADAAVVLRDLEDAHLVLQNTPGRYRMHDLIRLYAVEQAQHQLTQSQRTAALDRLVSFYTHTAYAGERLLDPNRPAITLTVPSEGSVRCPPADIAAALAWFTAEHSCLLITLGMVAAQRNHAATWQLAWSLGTFHWRRGHACDNIATWRTALTAAQGLGDLVLQSHGHRRLGLGLARVGDHLSAIEHLHLALELAEKAGDVLGQAHTLHTCAWAWARQGNDLQALACAEHALKLLAANPIVDAEAVNLVGWYHARAGHYDQALNYCQTALDLCERYGNREGQADTLDSLGYIADNLGRHAEAADYYQRALTLFVDLGHTYEQANTLDNLGRARQALGQLAEAGRVWRQALALYETQSRDVDARRVAEHLAELA